MNIAQRFSLMMKGNVTAVLDRLEDPERSLNQLILDMKEQLEAAKRATAAAMANEDRLERQIAGRRQEAANLEQSAKRALGKARESDARDLLRRAEQSRRQAEQLETKLVEQRNDTEAASEAVALLHERLEQACSRLHLIQAQIRRREAARAAGKARRGIEKVDLYGEFERIEGRIELELAEEKAYVRLDESLRGVDVHRRLEAEALDDAVEDRLASLRRELDGAT